jgi:hypothetical protein
MDAANILAPHQYGVGVPSGAESIIHSLQHSLTNKDAKLALLQVDISNAFNSCDRARVLRELYQHPKLSAMFRIADFGYAVPSQLLLQGCGGRHLLSSNGVSWVIPYSPSVREVHCARGTYERTKGEEHTRGTYERTTREEHTRGTYERNIHERHIR